MEPSLKTQKLLASWSWQDIYRVYATYGIQIDQYKDIKRDFNVPKKGETEVVYAGIHTEAAWSRIDFVRRFYLGVDMINRHLQALDWEITRRNKLIGVI